MRRFLANMLRWSPDGQPRPVQILTAMFGVVAPIVLGAATGHLELGGAACIGSLALSGAEPGRDLREHLAALTHAFVAGLAAMPIGAALAQRPEAVVIGVPIVAALAATLGGMSRPLARATTQFILFVVIATSFAERGIAPLELTLAFVLGGAWTAAVSLLLRRLLPADVASQDAAPAKPPLRALVRRWWRSLAGMTAWQYTVRISIALAVAEVLQYLWPGHHGHWIALTVAIVLRRQIQEGPTLTLQRALGTLCGVALAAVLLLWSLPLWAVVLSVAALAGARPILRAGNYTAYAAIMTPLIILLMELGQQPSASVIVDRLVATIVGCTLVFAADHLVWARLFAHGPSGKEPPGDTP